VNEGALDSCKIIYISVVLRSANCELLAVWFSRFDRTWRVEARLYALESGSHPPEAVVMDVLQIWNRGCSGRLVPYANPGRPYSNGDTSNP
jgi:hypothetical protein